MPHRHLSIVIPVFNGWALTAQCLRSLAEHTPQRFYEVLVVDNGSTDETVTELEPLGRELFDQRFTRLRQENNLNFGPACNLGARASIGELLLFLNNDTLLSPRWPGPLLQAFDQEPGLAAAGPLLLYPDTERVQHLGVVFTPSLGTDHLYCQFPAEHPVVGRSRQLQALTAAALVVRRERFFEVGGFHEGYRNGGEDMELCLRLRQRGGKLRCVPRSRVYHLESQSAGRFEHDEHNARLLNERCLGGFQPDLHIQAKRDGFLLRLTTWLEPYLSLPPEQEAELDARVPASVWDNWDILKKEPLWRKGYDPLAKALEQARQWEEALMVRFLECAFFPTPVAMGRLAALALRTGRADMAEQTRERLRRIQARLLDVEGLRAQARGLAAWARKAGAPELERLYASMAPEIGPASPISPPTD